MRTFCALLSLDHAEARSYGKPDFLTPIYGKHPKGAICLCAFAHGAAHVLSTDCGTDWRADWALKGRNDGNTQAHLLGTHLRRIDRFEPGPTFIDPAGAKEEWQE